MGRYLTIGLLYEVDITGDEDNNWEQFLDPEVWSLHEENDRQFLKLKDDISTEEFMSFRKDIYDYCGLDIEEDQQEEELSSLAKTHTLDQLFSIIKDKRFYNFYPSSRILVCGENQYYAKCIEVYSPSYKFLPDGHSSIPKLLDRILRYHFYNHRLSDTIISYVTP